MQFTQRRLSRREILKLGALGSAALILPLQRAARTADIGNRLPTSALPQPFQIPFAAPPVLSPVRSDETTDYYEVVQQSARVPILPGRQPTEVWGYNGLAPGPTIETRRGRQVVVRQINRLPGRTTSTHLHGSASLPQYDGYANDTTAPDFYKDYHYPNFQNARTLWYHDHGVHETAENAYMGLAGFYIMHDDHELSLPIPRGKYDVPLVIRDAIFGRDGQMIYDDQNHSSLMGDVILANGAPWPVMQVERRKYRFRVLNASISRSYRLALSTGDAMTVIATDGGLMPAPVETGSLPIGMAERYEVVIDFSKYKIGEQVVLRNLGLPNNDDEPSTARIMRFDVVSDSSDETSNEIPDVLLPGNPVMTLPRTRATRTRRFEFKRRNGMWTINGNTWDPKRVDANPSIDSVEIWDLVNASGGWFHPVHIHLIDFRILSRKKMLPGGTVQPPRPFERGPKDVAYVGEDEVVRVLMKFGPHKGKYMMHCHNLAHEDHDMMTQFEVGRGGTPWISDPSKPVSEMPPL